MKFNLMMTRRSLALFLLILPWFLASAVAQTSKDSKTKVALLAVTAPADLGLVHLVANEVKSADLELSVNNVSDFVEVSGNELQLKMSTKDIVLCRFTLPEAGKRFVVILSPAKPSGYKAHVVRTDDPSFKRGDCFFLNLTSKTILGKLGTKQFTLEASKSLIERPIGARKENFYDVAFATRGEEGDRILSTTRWPVDEQIRSYLFFIENQEGKITYRAVDEFVTEGT